MPKSGNLLYYLNIYSIIHLYFFFLNYSSNLELKNEYKQKRNRLISDLRNAEITYYSNEHLIYINII